jgi:hypothetical protein
MTPWTPSPPPLQGWTYSSRNYHRLYFKHHLDVKEIDGSWYVWIDGIPEQIPHSAMETACERAMSLARTKGPRRRSAS